MKWTQESKYHMRSGDYRIAKTSDGQTWRYEVWHKSTPLVFRLETAAEAQRVAEEHGRQ